MTWKEATKRIEEAQRTAKTAWEVAQGWLWLVLMWASIAVNFFHIEAILSRWARVSDWSTYLAAVIVETISGLSFSNALTNLSVMLASKQSRNVSDEKRRRARLYFGLSLAFGLMAVSFSGYVNVLWYNGAVLAGIVAPLATVICAVTEATRRYEVRVIQEKKQADEGAAKKKADAQKTQQAALKTLTAAQRRNDIVVVLQQGAQTLQQLAQRYNKDRTTLHRDLQHLAQQGKVKPNGGGTWMTV